MDQLTYKINLKPDDVTNFNKYFPSKITKKHLNNGFLIFVGLAIIAYFFKVLIYFLSLVFVLVLILFFYLYINQKKQKKSNLKNKDKLYNNECLITINFDKIVYGINNMEFKNLVHIVEDEKVYFFKYQKQFKKRYVYIIIPKRDINNLEFKNFILKVQEKHSFSWEKLNEE